MKLPIKYFVLLIMGLNFGQMLAQNIVYTDSIYNTKIHTVELHPMGNKDRLPVMSLRSIESLLLEFDVLSSDYEDYMYSFTHCNADWTQSELTTNEYLQGFEDSRIEEYAFSQNTKINYVHYYLSFPKEDMQPLVSGNYILKVYKEGQAETPAFTCRFMVVDTKTGINGIIKHSDNHLYRTTHQEVDFDINTKSMQDGFPAKDIRVDMMQNSNWYSIKTNIQPLNVSDDVMHFDLQNEDNTFWGLNRFRYFDFSSQKYNSEYIDRIISEGDTTRIVLLGSETRSHDKFAEQINMCGRFYIDTKDWENADTEGEYSLVYFTLFYPVPLPHAEVYIMGAFNQWQMNHNNRMYYDYEQKAYVGSLLLKQGFYSYLYMLHDTETLKNDYVFFENSFFDTDNTYNIMVYYRQPGTYYDQLIGYKIIK